MSKPEVYANATEFEASSGSHLTHVVEWSIVGLSSVSRERLSFYRLGDTDLPI